VPSIEDQKRHLKLTAMWAVDILMLGTQGVGIFLVAQFKGPVTPLFVVRVSMAASGMGLCVILIFIRRFIFGYMRESLHDLFGYTCESLDDLGRLSGTNGHAALQIFEQHVAVTGKLTEALDFLANDPNLSAETVEALRTILNGRPDKLALPKTVDNRDSGALE